MKTVLVIPAHNEEANIRDVLERAAGYVDWIIVVDDGSGDGTDLAAKSVGSNVTVLRHKINLGKGAALKTGCEAAVKLGADVIVMMDGDGQHPAEHIPEMLKAMKENDWQIIFSVREGGDKMPWVRFLGNRVLNGAARLLFNLNLRDIWCGLRAVRADVLPQIQWTNSDYSGEIQMALKAGKNGLRYGEHVIPAVYSDKFKGVMIMDGLKLLARMMIWRIKL